MVLYPPGRLAEVREGLDALGFQRQSGPDPFPEDRPMRTGSVGHDGTRFLLHAHVLAADSPEMSGMRAFRDWLRADPGLVARYVACKRSILTSGVTDPLEHCLRKGGFVAHVLRSLSTDKVSLRDKLARFNDPWSPKVVGELNGQHVKLVKFRGEFVWHRHDYEDELFLVVSGRFRMEFRDRHVWLEVGEFLIVPRGVEHRPVADEEVHVLLFEPVTTLNTGDVRDERTVDEPEWI
jgi:mannose-6-phosphate isomerase-like protein (cupin superfamily)